MDTTKPRNRSKETQRRSRKRLEAIQRFGDECYDCKQEYPSYVYDFHHLDPTQKRHMDSNRGLNFTMSDKNIQEELDKCIMLCSNCHRIRHWKESQWKAPETCEQEPEVKQSS